MKRVGFALAFTAALGFLVNVQAVGQTAKKEKDGRTSYAELIAEAHTRYPFADHAAAVRMLEELHELSADWAVYDGLLGRNTPRPASDLRAMPRV